MTLPILADAASAAAAAAVNDATWHARLVGLTVLFAIVVIVTGMFLCLYRLLHGPHLADRALAVDVISIQLIGLVILLTIRYGTTWFVDGVMVLSLIGFAGTVAMAQFIARPHVKQASHHKPAAERGPSMETDTL